MVWGLLPFDFEVSFEAHICGAISGLVLAVVYRDQGPEPERSELDDEEEDWRDDAENGRVPGSMGSENNKPMDV
jgi:hypothetical protein